MSRRPLFLFAILAIPLQTPDGWHHMKFSGPGSSVVTHSAEGLSIKVDESASPLFYALPRTVQVKSVTASGTLSALPNLPAGKVDGDDGADDFPLRVGLVVEGNRGLALLERLIAPAWLKELSDLVPGKKIDQVLFLELAQRRAIGARRRHPKSNYLAEEVVAQITAPGPFHFSEPITPPPSVFALWIQPDGDDTHSKFEMVLKSLTLETD